VNDCRGHTRVLRLLEVPIWSVGEESSASAPTIKRDVEYCTAYPKATHMRLQWRTRKLPGSSNDWITSLPSRTVGLLHSADINPPFKWLLDPGNPTSFGQKLGLDDTNPPAEGFEYQNHRLNIHTMKPNMPVETVLVFAYARLEVGQLTGKLASLPLIKVFCSRISHIGFTSTMLSESSKHQGARLVGRPFEANG